jgi:uncharacterized protein (DUF2062 family)
MLLAQSRIKVTAAAAGHSQQLVPLRSTTLLSTVVKSSSLSSNLLIAHGTTVTWAAMVASSLRAMPMLRISDFSLTKAILMLPMTPLVSMMKVRSLLESLALSQLSAQLLASRLP